MTTNGNRNGNRGGPRRKRGNVAGLTPWVPGQSGNPAGGIKRGQSWGEIVREVGDLTPEQLRPALANWAKALDDLPPTVTLKTLVVLRVYIALLSDPSAGLLGLLMERAEGKIPSSLELTGKDGGPIELEHFRSLILVKLGALPADGAAGELPDGADG